MGLTSDHSCRHMDKSAPPGNAFVDRRTNDRQIYRLYVSSGSPVSARAIVNARRFLERHLPGQHDLQVLDIGKNVAAAAKDHIFASPTLVRVFPAPARRLIGDMTDTERLRIALSLPPEGGT